MPGQTSLKFARRGMGLSPRRIEGEDSRLHSGSRQIVGEAVDRRLAMLGEMAARMAHELRNPLGSIALFASLIHKELAYDPEKARWAEHISTAVGAMDYAISNLLCFSGRPIPRFSKTNLQNVLSEVAAFSDPAMQKNGICFVRSIALPEEIWGDAHLLRQILLNLVLNAVDAMPEGGTLEIKAAPYLSPDRFDADGACKMQITVADTGEGIACEVLPHIFDPFFTTKNKGTGLGLAVVRNAVTAYGGTITVACRKEGGTCFTLILPAAEAEVQ